MNKAKALSFTIRMIDAWLPQKIRYSRIPGISVGIISGNKLVYKRGFGYADIESKKRADAGTLYRIASISKTFTAVSILQLAEEGKLKLSDPVGKYLPWFNAHDRKTTINDLLSHTSGIFRDGTESHWTTDEFHGKSGLIASMTRESLIPKQRGRFKYSNFGFAVLGEVVESASGMRYENYLRKNIIGRLRMRNTFVDYTPPIKHRLAVPYGIPPLEGRREKFRKDINTNAYAPAAGLSSNVNDLALYVSDLFIKSRSVLLSKKFRLAMTKKHSKIDKADSYGLGIALSKVGKRTVLSHGGGFPGFRTQISADKKNSIGAITLTNSLNDQIGFINLSVFHTYYSFLDDRKYFGKRGKSLRRYEGLYHLRWGDIILVDTGGSLTAINPLSNHPMLNRSVLLPEKDGSFLIETDNRFDSPGEKARFIPDKSGAIKQLRWGSILMEKVD